MLGAVFPLTHTSSCCGAWISKAVFMTSYLTKHSDTFTSPLHWALLYCPLSLKLWPLFTFALLYRNTKRAGIAQSVWRMTMGWTVGWSRFESWRGLGISLFDTVSGTALWPTQPPFQWVPAGVKRPGFEAYLSPQFNAEVKECVDLYLHSPVRLKCRGA
jgi:hypothetical protein